MSKIIDETGNTYGYLTVLSRAENDKQGHAQWLCQCKCGNQIVVKGSALRKTNGTKSCGCYQKEQTSKASTKNLIGQTIGNFTVLESIIGEKYGKKHSWRCRCNLCGSEDNIIATSNLYRQYSCGCSISSKGQKKIADILRENNIEFTQEKRFSTCVFGDGGQAQARFDFYLPQYNCLIEYDGQQHFIEGKGYFDNPKKFQKTKEHDQIKNNWCKQNHIFLIRIPYTHYDKIILEDLLPNTSRFLL